MIFLIAILLPNLAASFSPFSARAASLPPPATSPLTDPTSGYETSAGPKPQSAEDDFKETPYTKYGDFFSEEEEEEDLKFFQYGRFFGVAVSAGIQGATGNLGLVYTSGVPLLDFKALYWFDFQFALALNASFVKQSGFASLPGDTDPQKYTSSYTKLGADFRYYIDTTNLASQIAFAGPYVLLGVGNYNRRLTASSDATNKTNENSFGFNGGVGFEFALKPRKTYLNLETKIHKVNFSDTNSSVDLSGGTTLPNQHGLLYTLTMGLLFTW